MSPDGLDEQDAQEAREPAVIGGEPADVALAAEKQRIAAERRRLRRHAVKSARRKIGLWIAVALGPYFVRLLAWTWKPVVEGAHNVEAARGADGGHVMAFWHGSMLVPVMFHAHRNYHAVISRSGDGDVPTAILRRLGYGAVRGSTRDAASSALREMKDLLEKGGGLAVTPDGPKGPRYSVRRSLAWLARETGHAIVPCGFVAARAWHLPSWDRFTIPKPFSRVALVYGEPLRVPSNATEADLAAATTELRERILNAERRGYALLGVPPDS
jgi:lysophospholipid acyltransferase (LPLAT)-like uncharacterized protein